MAGSFLLVSVAAYYLLKNRHQKFAEQTMKVGLLIAFSTAILQLVSGDHLSRKVATHNPEKFAAFEGVYETKSYAPAYLWGWVDTDEQIVKGISIPGLLSFITHRDFAAPIQGLKEFPQDHWPWVPVVFQLYHIMVLCWGAMMVAALLGVYFWWRNNWQMNRWVLKFLVASVLFPQIANIAGWYASCMGRQPWVVYKLLKTQDAYSPLISSGQVLGSLIMFVIMYLLFFVLFLVLLDRKIKAGPDPDMDEEELPYRNVFKG